MMMIERTTSTCMISFRINGICCLGRESFHYQDQEPKVYFMITSCISLVGTKRRVATFIKIYFITIFQFKSGLMLALNKVETCLVRGLTTLSFFGTVVYLCMEAMMERKGLVICTNVVLRMPNTNGRKFKVMEHSLLIDSVTQQ